MKLLWRWLHLAVLWTFAMAQPLLQILADEPAFFIARDNTSADIVALALILTLGPPTILLAVETALWKLTRVQDAVHLVFVAGLAATLVLQFISDLDTRPILVAALAALGGCLFAAAYGAFQPVRSTLSVLAPVPLLVVAWFLFLSPVADLLFPDEVDVAISEEPLRSTPPIVFVVFDEFFGGAITNSTGRIDESRYPNFAALAEEATWYRNATTVGYETTTAVPALLTGRYPPSGALPTADDYPRNLFTLLANSYSMDVSEPVTSLCPSTLCEDPNLRPSLGGRWRSLTSDLSVVALHTVTPERARSRLPAVDQTFQNFGGDDDSGDAGTSSVTQVAGGAARKVGWERFSARASSPASRPTLHFYHSLLPHVPWKYLPTGREYAGADVPGLAFEKWAPEPEVVEVAQQRFLLQLGFVDRQVGQLMARLKEAGVFDEALVVVTADHGVSFRAGQSRRVAEEENPGDIASVPLFVKLPGQLRGGIDDSPVRTVDLLPTIRDLLGAESGESFDGRSFLTGPPRSLTEPLPIGDRGEFAFSEILRSKAESVRQMIRRFGQNDGFEGVYAPRSDRALLGIPVADAPAKPGASVRLAQASQLGDVQLASEARPAYLTGSIVGAKAGQRVGLAVNGRIRAVTETFSEGDVMRFAAVISPDSLRQGHNSFELLAIAGSDDPPRLVSLGRATGDRFRLTEDDRGDVVLGPDGTEFPVADGPGKGYIDQVNLDAGFVRGWAVNAAAKRPADRVLVFAEDRLLGSGVPTAFRSDLAEPIGPWATHAGYLVTVSTADVESGELRVFVLAGGRATEL